MQTNELKETLLDFRVKRYLSLLGIGVALALLIATTALVRRQSVSSTGANPASVERALDRIKKEGVLNVGYGIWAPYTMESTNGEVEGFSVDLVNEIAKHCSPPLVVKWHKFSWQTMKADLSSKSFDFVAESVFQTIPRAEDFGLGEPYAAFGIGAAVVRRNDNRFVQFDDLDKSNVTIVLAEGWTTSELAASRLHKSHLEYVTIQSDPSIQMDWVASGRADVALNDVPTVADYVAAHQANVKALWLTNPPSFVVGGFVTRPEDTDLLAFLNASIRILRADGTIDRLDAKWKTKGWYEEFQLRPGAGLKLQ